MRGEHLEEVSQSTDDEINDTENDNKNYDKHDVELTENNKVIINCNSIEKVEENLISQTEIIKLKGQTQLMEYEEYEKTCEDLDGWDDIISEKED